MSGSQMLSMTRESRLTEPELQILKKKLSELSWQKISPELSELS
jgi:hypothetical protein